MLLVLCLALTGCRTREIVQPTVAVNDNTTAEHFFDILRTQSSSFSTFTAKLNFDFTPASGKGMSSRGTLKIIHNQRLELSFQPLAGFEVMRLEISTDSVKMLDRMNKRYIADSFDKLRGEMHLALTFSNLQSILTNAIFLPGESELADNAFARFEYDRSATGLVFRAVDTEGIKYSFEGCSNGLCATDIASGADRLNINYSAFETLVGRAFPMNINAQWSEKEVIKGSVQVRYSNIEYDAPVEIKFTVPKNYERVGLAQILKIAGE